MSRCASAVLVIVTFGGCGGRQERKQDPAVLERPGGPPVAASPNTMLQSGGVRSLQRALRARGYEAPVSGAFDARTREALLKFQRAEGLAPTSMPDMLTLEALGLNAEELYGDL